MAAEADVLQDENELKEVTAVTVAISNPKEHPDLQNQADEEDPRVMKEAKARLQVKEEAGKRILKAQ